MGSAEHFSGQIQRSPGPRGQFCPDEIVRAGPRIKPMDSAFGTFSPVFFEGNRSMEFTESPMAQAPTSIYQDGTYLAHNQTWHVEDSPWKAREIERMFARNKLDLRTVCEVGCGAGEILTRLCENTRETKYFGYELSPQAFELCRTRQTERIKFFNTNLLDEDVRFDCLLCIDVFEHVEDYFGFIRGLRSKAEYKVFHIPLDINVLSILRGGLMAARESIGHLQYFTPETAIATLKECGYEIIDDFYTMKEPTTFKGQLAKYPRKLLFAVSPFWLSRLLGGCEYMVLAR